MKQFVIALVATASLLTLGACNGTKTSNNTTTETLASAQPTAQVEVIYFYGKQRCATCMAIENETKALMEGELAELVKQGKVMMRVVDFTTDEGKALARKYKVTFSSLFVVTNPGTNEKAEDLTRFAFANARSNAEAFRKELKEKVMAEVTQ